jgi:hypothetical protein
MNFAPTIRLGDIESQGLFAILSFYQVETEVSKDYQTEAGGRSVVDRALNNMPVAPRGSCKVFQLLATNPMKRRDQVAWENTKKHL